MTDVTVVKRLDDVTTMTTTMTMTPAVRGHTSRHGQVDMLPAVHIKGSDEPSRRVNPKATFLATSWSRDVTFRLDPPLLS